MAWVELAGQRSRRGRRYQHSDDPNRFVVTGAPAALHHESDLDSGVHDTQLDCAPVRVDNAQFDGWRVTTNGWHFALGQPVGQSDGWIGFGGRQGQNWLRFRLLRTGYLHWPTRTWDDVGGMPTYDRTNLSRETATISIGPNDDSINVAAQATWSGVWATPGGGDVSARWHVNGDRLKEDVILNQAARTWIINNQPPATPLDETWFGFVFHVDWSDIPTVLRNEIVQDVESDFADDGHDIELRDATNRLLAFLPLADVVVSVGGIEVERQPLRKRIWRDGSDYYLLIGLRCDTLAGMADGDLVFDPTINVEVDASSDDARQDYGTVTLTDSTLVAGNNTNWFGFRWTGVNVPSGATITTAYSTWYIGDASYDDPSGDIYCEDGNNPGTFVAAANNISGRSLTTASTNWSTTGIGTGEQDTPSLVDEVQEVVDGNGGTGSALCVLYSHDALAGAGLRVQSWDAGAEYAAWIYIEYTVSRVPRYGFTNFQVPGVV